MPVSRLGQIGVGVQRYISFAGKTAAPTAAPITRLMQFAVGGRRYGSFSGKTPAVGGGHPVGNITRLGQMPVGVQRYVSFAGKTPAGPGGRIIDNITRLGQMGVGTQRYDSFAGKTPATPEISLHGRRRGRRKFPDEVILKSPEGLDKPPPEPPLPDRVIEYPTFDPSVLKGRVDSTVIENIAADMKAMREARDIARKKKLKRQREEEEVALLLSFFDD